MNTVFPQKIEHPFIIVGLGNPGRVYGKNRHNIGFLLLDRLAETLDLSFSRFESKALVTKTSHNGKRLILAKPQTYMNLAGQSVAQLVRFYKNPLENLLIVYDDIDLPLGAIRIRPDGGSGGHKGMHSIIQLLGTNEFPRMRLGIGRPSGRLDAAAYVLQDFSNSDLEVVFLVLDKATKAVLTFTNEGLDSTMNQFNRPEHI